MQYAAPQRSFWDSVLDHIVRQPPPPAEPSAPTIDEGAWAKSVDQARISDHLTVHDLGLIVFNESQSYSDRPDSNEPIDGAREKMANSVINADRKFGQDRQQKASTALPIEPSANVLRDPGVRAAYDSSMKAAREAYLTGTDPTNGAVYLNQRGDASRGNRIMSSKKPEGVPLSTQSGPYDNSYTKGKVTSGTAWLNTYYDQ